MERHIMAVANLNAACILLSQGDTKDASLYLDKAGESPEKTLLQGIMQMLNGNWRSRWDRRRH